MALAYQAVDSSEYSSEEDWQWLGETGRAVTRKDLNAVVSSTRPQSLHLVRSATNRAMDHDEASEGMRQHRDLFVIPQTSSFIEK